MAEINLVNTTERADPNLVSTDRMAIWPVSVDEVTDLQFVTLSSLVGYVETNAAFLDESIVTAKGDLLVANTSGDIGVLSVGTDESVLIADSGETLGVRWGAIDTDGIASRAVTSDKLKVLDVSTLTGANITLDFTGAGHLTHALTGNTTYTVNTATYGPGRTLTIRITATNTRLLTFPSSWVFLGTRPTAILANKNGVLSVTCFGTTEADCVAAWAVST